MKKERKEEKNKYIDELMKHPMCQDIKTRINNWAPKTFVYDEDLINRLKQKAFDYCDVVIQECIPVIKLCDYYPVDRGNGDVVEQLNRELIWCFKNDTDNYTKEEYQEVYIQVLSAIGSNLRTCFGDDLPECVLFTIPASSMERDARRWCHASSDLSVILGTRSGYHGRAYYLDQNKPNHLNFETKKGFPVISYDKDMFTPGTPIILIDDLITSGYTLKHYKDELEKQTGAVVIAAITIGMTVPKDTDHIE